MTQEYPYVLVPDNFREFMKKLGSVGVPDRVDTKYVASLGFKSSNHRRFPGVLRFVSLIGSDGRPTDRYKTLRGGDEGRRKLGAYIREAYADLFNMYADADRKDTEALRNFFRARTDLGDRAVGAMAATFQTLCGLALFDSTADAATKLERPEPPGGPQGPREGRVTTTRGGLIVNVNIQLELPATTDGDVYDKLFASMARHILKFGED
jgi:hypothetical protein